MTRRIATSLLLIAGLLCAGDRAAAQAPATCVDSQAVLVDSGGTNGVRAVIAVDLDDDGDADVVSASQNDDTIAWYERVGTSFTQRIIDDDAAGAAALFAIDLDQDGFIDILAASANDDTIAWYENTGETPPRFVQHVITSLANGASSVFAIDMDSDSDIDVVSASANDDMLAWYENTGNSIVFTRNVITIAADGAASVFAIDLDEDGRVDVVYAARQSDTVAWCQNTLDTNQTPLDPADDKQVWVDHVLASNVDGAAAVFVVDLDSDADLDVISASTNDDKIAWFESDGAELPQFTKRIISGDADGATSVFAIDVDGDGPIDVLSASRNDGEVHWYRNDGQTPNTQFSQQPAITTSPGASSVHAIVNPTIPGVAVATAASVAGSIALDDEIALHESSVASPAPVSVHLPVSGLAVAPASIVLANLGGSAALDLIVASSSERSILWYENLGASFTRHEVDASAPGVSALFVADLDASNGLDVLAADDDTIAWYENDGAANFTEHSITSDAEGASSVFAADLDGVNGLDVLAASAGDDTIAWYENDGAASFTEHVLTTAASGASAVSAADIDGDTLLDVVYASADDDTVAWLEQVRTDGATEADPDAPDIITFDEHVVTIQADSPRALAVAQIDEDELLDVAVISSGDDTVAWYEQARIDGATEEDPDALDIVVFLRHVVTTQANFPRALGLVDLNADALLDIVVVSSADDTVAWYEQVRKDGATEADPDAPDIISFVEHVLSTNTNGAQAVVAGPLDSDATVDIAVGSLFRLAYHPGGAVEACEAFDVDGDDRMDGVELGWLGLAFGESCDPGPDWWDPIDLNQDCLVDGEDLAILTSVGVWGRSTGQESESACHFTCPVTEAP